MEIKDVELYFKLAFRFRKLINSSVNPVILNHNPFSGLTQPVSIEIILIN